MSDLYNLTLSGLLVSPLLHIGSFNILKAAEDKETLFLTLFVVELNRGWEIPCPARLLNHQILWFRRWETRFYTWICLFSCPISCKHCLVGLCLVLACQKWLVAGWYLCIWCLFRGSKWRLGSCLDLLALSLQILVVLQHKCTPSFCELLQCNVYFFATQKLLFTTGSNVIEIIFIVMLVKFLGRHEMTYTPPFVDYDFGLKDKD